MLSLPRSTNGRASNRPAGVSWRSKTSTKLLASGLVAAAIATTASPAAAAVSEETQYILNTFSFLVNGFLVMFMAAGFAMLEAGSVRAKNVSAIILKNVSLYALAGLMFYLVGYNLMYAGVDGGYIGELGIWQNKADANVGDGYAPAADWFFQMVFVATTASIVSGAVAERVKVWPFLLFVAVLTAVIYPMVGAWHWGYGWLNPSLPQGADSWEQVAQAGGTVPFIIESAGSAFADFAGSTLVHSTGGWAALMGAIIIGSRRGRFNANGSINPLPGNSIPLVGLGTFILWLGWFGFNGGSQLALGSAADANAMASIYINTNAAAAGGVLIAMLLTQVLTGRMDLFTVLNSALGGLVAITAGPDTPSMGESFIIGGIGGSIVFFGTNLLLKFKIDDVVGAIPVHLFCGVWGTMAVPFTNEGASFTTQFIGVAAVAVFTVVVSGATWSVLKIIIGLRSSEEAETVGLDQAELGHSAYPEFTKM